MIRRIISKILRAFKKAPEKPVIYDDYLEALFINGDYFYEIIDKCVDPYGYSYGSGWHFFTSVVKYMNILPENDIISDFEKFLKIIYHENVYTGFRLNFKRSEGLKEFPPPFLPFLTPWSPYNIKQLESKIDNILNSEKLLAGSENEDKNPLKNTSGLASNHYNRLLELRDSIREKGYQFYKKLDDPILGYILHRGNEHKILIFSGQHRLATMSGLDFKKVPIKFASKYIIRAEDVERWPLVKCGLWDSEDALLYYNHLFDFDSHTWASDNGLRVYD